MYVEVALDRGWAASLLCLTDGVAAQHCRGGSPSWLAGTHRESAPDHSQHQTCCSTQGLTASIRRVPALSGDVFQHSGAGSCCG